ncbi:hypothetical protein TcCL_Unassigned05020 [Trypanosoma cruzi]|nr:hypothetical protein TcCL_Unassigned05020 [Trypanosoma cruzi]
MCRRCTASFVRTDGRLSASRRQQGSLMTAGGTAASPGHQRWGPHLVAVLGLWLHIGTPQQGVAASTTETKTTPPLEKVPRHARCGEVKRSARRLSDKTARPFRCGHSVDIPRGGDVHKNPGTEEDGCITVWRLIIAGLSSVKGLNLLYDWSCINPTSFLSRK